MIAHTTFVALCLPKETLPKLPCPSTTPRVKSVKAVQGFKRPGECAEVAECGVCDGVCKKAQESALDPGLTEFSHDFKKLSDIRKLFYVELASAARVPRSKRSYDGASEDLQVVRASVTAGEGLAVCLLQMT